MILNDTGHGGLAENFSSNKASSITLHLIVTTNAGRRKLGPSLETEGSSLPIGDCLQTSKCSGQSSPAPQFVSNNSPGHANFSLNYTPVSSTFP